MSITQNLWNFHTDPNKLVGWDRPQLRAFVSDRSEESVHPGKYDWFRERRQDPYLQQALLKSVDSNDLADLTDLGYYAGRFMNGHWYEAEQLIIQQLKRDKLHTAPAFAYMQGAGLKVWPKLEEILITMSTNIRKKNDRLIAYASIMRKPWPDAEPYILQDPSSIYEYASRVLRQPWPEGEAVLARSADKNTRQYLWFFPNRKAALEQLGYSPLP